MNGQNLSGRDDVSRLLENTAGKRVIAAASRADASGANAREITVIPVASETAVAQRRRGSKATAARWMS